MTNDEFASMTSHKTPFIVAVNKSYFELFKGLKDEANAKFAKTPLGNYVWKVQSLISDIEQNLEDIRYTEKMLLNHMPGRLPLKKDMNAAQDIRYHYENYLLRTTKIKDMCLLLINQVMGLNLKKGLNMENQLLKRVDPAYGNFTLVWDYMKELTDHIKPYRNHLAHNGTVQMSDLAFLSAHYTFDIEHKDFASEFRYEAGMNGIQRELVEKFTAQTKVYLLGSEQVLKIIYIYLGKPFLDNLDLILK